MGVSNSTFSAGVYPVLFETESSASLSCCFLLQENSKSLSKGSLARRQKQLERAPNKSNSITNVLNADEEKLVTVQSQLAPTKQKQAQPSNKDSVISLVSTMDRNTDASTQTFCLANEASRLPQSSDAANSRTNFTMQPTFSDLGKQKLCVWTQK